MKQVIVTPTLDKDILPPTYRGIPVIPIIELSEENYWKSQASMGQKVEPLSKPCGDCAISTGYYVDHAESLSRQPEETQKAVLEKWFCHNDCNRGCKGVRNYLQKP